MNICKHYEGIFKKFDITIFVSDTNSFIAQLGELIGKHCKYFFQFEIETCKWKIFSSSIIDKNLKLFKTGCGCNTPEYNINDIKKGLCPACGKKIEVVE